MRTCIQTRVKYVSEVLEMSTRVLSQQTMLQITIRIIFKNSTIIVYLETIYC